MGRFGKFCIRMIYMLTDACFGYLAIFLACLIRSHKVPFNVNLHSVLFDAENPFRLVFALWLLMVIIINRAHRLYHTDRMSSEISELLKVLQSNFIGMVLVIVASYLLKVEGLPRTVVAIGFLLMALFFSLWRVIKRFIVESLVIRGYNNRNVLIIGAGKAGRGLKEEIERYPGMGLRVKGFLDDAPEHVDEDLRGLVLGKIIDFRRIATQYFIDHVFVTAYHTEEVFLKLLLQARKFGIAVDVVPFGYRMISGDLVKHNIGFVPLLSYSPNGKGQHNIGKRIFDLIVAWSGCILLAVPFLAIGILIILDGAGPVFYFSERFGRGGKRFKMMKFRTMIVGADRMQEELRERNEADGPIFKMRDDPRVTRFGKFLRKYSLDELPQLFNVIKGDMSLVGPRPFPVDQIESSDLRQLRRLGVRPGITGLWQVKGRSDAPFGRLLRWDIWYINNWSFGLDLSILWQTIPAVVKGRGAY
ncbi:MAG: sugar transferase [Candidatus Omnitrophota bacterium]